jgi:hypothetical protein
MILVVLMLIGFAGGLAILIIYSLQTGRAWMSVGSSAHRKAHPGRFWFTIGLYGLALGYLLWIIGRFIITGGF